MILLPGSNFRDHFKSYFSSFFPFLFPPPFTSTAVCSLSRIPRLSFSPAQFGFVQCLGIPERPALFGFRSLTSPPRLPLEWGLGTTARHLQLPAQALAHSSCSKRKTNGKPQRLLPSFVIFCIFVKASQAWPRAMHLSLEMTAFRFFYTQVEPGTEY